MAALGNPLVQDGLRRAAARARAGRTTSSGGPRTRARAGGTGGNTGTSSVTSRCATSPGPTT
eukprot:9757791-Alexandrium_andersonii.AAC.1